HLGARFGHALGDGEPDPLGRAGDERCLAVQSEVHRPTTLGPRRDSTPSNRQAEAFLFPGVKAGGLAPLCCTTFRCHSHGQVLTLRFFQLPQSASAFASSFCSPASVRSGLTGVSARSVVEVKRNNLRISRNFRWILHTPPCSLRIFDGIGVSNPQRRRRGEAVTPCRHDGPPCEPISTTGSTPLPAHS